MFAISLPIQILNKISRFWVVFFSITALLWWSVDTNLTGGYITVMCFLMIAPLAILMRSIFIDKDARIWLHYVMLIPYVIVLVMLYFGLAGKESVLILWANSFLQ